jgi:hypothetical protein
VEGGVLDGIPEIVCEANEQSPVGTYDIVIGRGTESNFNVTYVKGTLTITKAPLTISAGTYTKKQGDPMPDFTLTYDGFKNNETKEVLTKQPTVSCMATKVSAPGEYAVKVSGAEAQNYAISYTDGKLVVTEADAVTITARSYTRQYGDSNPFFEYDVIGASLDGEPEIVCEANEQSPVGTYDIIIGRGTESNFNVTYIKGTLTITKAPLTVSVGNYEREVNQENPVFIITYAGWKNHEDESVLNVKPIVTTEATRDSKVGTYDIIIKGGEAQNYDFEYVNGVLTVTEALGIEELLASGKLFNIYTITGQKVPLQETPLRHLPAGIYIIAGKKVSIR